MSDDGLRELLHGAVPHSTGIDPDTLRPYLRPRATRRAHRPAGWLVAAAALIVLLGGVVAVLVRHNSGDRPVADGPGSAAPTATRPQDYAALVLRVGDRVTIAGEVRARRGRAVQMCAPTPTDLPENLRPQPILACASGVVLRGADLHRLSARRTLNGDIAGFATVTGTWDHGVVDVHQQQPGGAATRSIPADRPPCPAPRGGWPKRRINLTAALDGYSKAHPGAIITPAVLHPAPGHDVVYALTSGDPAPVDRALRGAYGASLCVVRSLHSAGAITHAERAFNVQLRAHSDVIGIGAFDIGADGQLQVDVSLVQVTPQLAALAARQERGIVVLDPWLHPAGR